MAPPAFAAPGEDDDEGAGAPPALLLLLLPLLPLPPPATAAAAPEFDAARAEAARLPPSPPPPDDVAATMAAQGLAATGAAGCSSGIPRGGKRWKERRRGLKKSTSSISDSQKNRRAETLSVSPFFLPSLGSHSSAAPLKKAGAFREERRDQEQEHKRECKNEGATLIFFLFQ